jgi:hypothetical protein
MARSPTALANALDALVGAGRVSVTETGTRLVAYQLEGTEAARLALILGELGDWGAVSIADDGGEIPLELVAGSGGGITLSVSKPACPEGIELILTRSGLSQAFARPEPVNVIWFVGAVAAFETLRTRVAPVGDATGFAPATDGIDTSKIVRILAPGQRRYDLARWLLRDPFSLVEGVGLDTWRSEAVARLAAALANEVEPDGRLLFRGPPIVRFEPQTRDLVTPARFAALQAAAAWVYANPREAEARHGLFATELARTVVRGGSADDVAEIAGSALEGARLAFAFGLERQSADALKALGDLRRSVSDEVAKVGENARAIAAAVAAAAVGNVALIAARLTVPMGSSFVRPAALMLAAVLGLYVASIILGGALYLVEQHRLRRDWRQHLYRFLSPDDYARLVSRPAARATSGFVMAAVLGLIMAGLMFGAVWLIIFS